MFQQFYEPHPALKEFVNNIMIHHVMIDASQPQLRFSVPPLPEHCLFFYVRDSSDAEDVASKKKETQLSSIIVGPQTTRHIITGRNFLTGCFAKISHLYYVFAYLMSHFYKQQSGMKKVLTTLDF